MALQFRKIHPNWQVTLDGFDHLVTFLSEKAPYNTYISIGTDNTFDIRVSTTGHIMEINAFGSIDTPQDILFLPLDANTIMKAGNIAGAGNASYKEPKVEYSEVCGCKSGRITEELSLFIQHFNISTNPPICFMECSTCKQKPVAYFVEPV